MSMYACIYEREREHLNANEKIYTYIFHIEMVLMTFQGLELTSCEVGRWAQKDFSFIYIAWIFQDHSNLLLVDLG
jgi:hypothetical protein